MTDGDKLLALVDDSGTIITVSYKGYLKLLMGFFKGDKSLQNLIPEEFKSVVVEGDLHIVRPNVKPLIKNGLYSMFNTDYNKCEKFIVIDNDIDYPEVIFIDNPAVVRIKLDATNPHNYFVPLSLILDKGYGDLIINV